MLSKIMADDRPARQQLNTPIGRLTIEAGENGVRKITLGAQRERETTSNKCRKHLQQAKKEIEEYFSGLRTNFKFTVDLKGTSFQRKVWSVAKRIPYGKTISYKEIACRLGDPKAARAVGAALRSNPVPIVIPCHRVVSSTGDLTGFVGGVEKKEWLIEHEV